VSVVQEWPELLGAVAGVATIAFLVVLRRRGERGSVMERRILALFLAGMPVVYVASWLVSRQPGWLLPEVVGLIVFGALALLGLRGSPWFLAVGILCHGVFWDAWHYWHTTFIPSWYVVACLLTDVALGAYVATQVSHFLARGVARG
jgi:hypothetical protein